MPLEFTCPHCQARTVVDEEYLGLSGPCFQCGKIVVVPLKPSASMAENERQRARERRMWRVSLMLLVTGMLVGIGVLFVGGSLLQPVLQASREWTHRMECDANLKRIATALRLYHDRHGRFPPAYLPGPDGKPAHSWRVLILPELGEQDLYSQYRFDEPWDSSNNSLLQTRMPAVYGCQADPNSITQSDTSYLAILGKRTAFNVPDGRPWTDFVDGAANTLLVVESQQSGIGWTEPRDLPFNALAQGVNGPGKLAIRSSHATGAHAATADGKVRCLGVGTSVELLEAMATVDGREVVEATVER